MEIVKQSSESWKPRINFNKRAVFFTFLAIMIIGIMIIMVISNSQYTVKNRIAVDKGRITNANDFMRNLGSDYLERSLFTSSQRALHAMNKIITYTNNPPKDLCQLESIILDGTYDNTSWIKEPVLETPPPQTQSLYLKVINTVGDSIYDHTDPLPAGFSGWNSVEISNIQAVNQQFQAVESGTINTISFAASYTTASDTPVQIELRRGDCEKPGRLLALELFDISDSAVEAMQAQIRTIQLKKEVKVSAGDYYYIVFKSYTSENNIKIIVMDVLTDGISAQITQNVTSHYNVDHVIQSLAQSFIKYKVMGPESLNNLTKLLSVQTKEFLHIDTNISVESLEIYQNNKTGPWRVGINATFLVNVNGSISSWKKEVVVETSVSIIGLNDPIYMYYIPTFSDKPINNTLYDTWNKGRMLDMLWTQKYKFDPKAPSYLSRLQNITTVMPDSECCGIESLVLNFTDHFLRTKSPPETRIQSFVDYCYFGGKCEMSIEDGEKNIFNVHEITRAVTPPEISYNFSLEPYHLAQYNISASDTEYICCE